MNLEELKLLDDVELQEVHQKAVDYLRGVTSNGSKPNQQDFVTNMKLVVDPGQLLRERGIIKEEPKRQETEEEKEERMLKYRRASRNDDIGYIVKGALLLLGGIVLSSIMEGRYFFYGAILLGIGFIGIGLYGRLKSE